MKKLRRVMGVVLSTAMCVSLVPGASGSVLAEEEDITITMVESLTQR